MSRRNILRLWQDRSGAFAPISALTMVALLGFAALTIDMGYNYFTRNKLQMTADASALAGAQELLETDGDEVAMRVSANYYAEENMAAADYGDVLVDGDIVAGNWDADSRTFTPALDPINAVMTTTRRQEASGNAVPAFLGGIAGFDSYDITTSGIATLGRGPDINPDGCITATNTSEPDAFYIFGTADITLDGCDILVASDDPCGMHAHGTPTITNVDGSDGAGIYYNEDGGYCESGPVNMDPYPAPTDTTIEDPYRNEPDPYPDLTDSDCDFFDAAFEGSAIIPRGVYCGGITWTGNGTATFEDGVYIIKDGPLSIGGNITVQATGANADGTINDQGVGFYLTGETAEVNFKGTSDVAMKAPTSGVMKGFIFYEDPDNPPTTEHTLRGTNDGGYDGVLYFQGDVELKGTAGSGLASPSDCTMLIADTVYFNGTTSMQASDTCSSFGGAPTGLGDMMVRLVE